MTQMALNVAGVWKALLPWIRGVSWSPVLVGSVRGASTWDEFFENFTASADKSSLVKLGTAATLVTGGVTITPTGGTSPYIYAWARHSGSASIGINAPTNATTTFSATLVLGDSADAVFYCTITDANGHTVVVAVAVHIERTVSG